MIMKVEYQSVIKSKTHNTDIVCVPYL